MLGERIALLRRSQGMSQQALARAISVSASAVGMYEQGRREPPIDRIVALARLFGVSTDYLLTGLPHSQADLCAASGARACAQEPDRAELRRLLEQLLGA